MASGLPAMPRQDDVAADLGADFGGAAFQTPPVGSGALLLLGQCGQAVLLGTGLTLTAFRSSISLKGSVFGLGSGFGSGSGSCFGSGFGGSGFFFLPSSLP